MISARKHRLVQRFVRLLSLTAWFGCSSELQGEVDGEKFVRCAQVRPPAERSYRAGALQLTIRERTLQIDGPPLLRLAAFTGPVGRTLSAQDLAALRADEPALALMLGGLGDDETQARENLTRLAALRIPTLFVAGGADRWPIVEAAFAALPERERDWVINGSGLRELRVEARPRAREPRMGDQRFVIAAGAALGRYALDERACGLAPEDVSAIQSAALGAAQPARRSYLLSWHAPSGFGVSEGFAGSELGSPDLMALARTLGLVGGLFAFPEPQAVETRGSAREQTLAEAKAWVVPRLGAPGTQRGDGARLQSQVGRWQLGPDGLSPRP